MWISAVGVSRRGGAENVKLNNLSNVALCNIAVGDTPGTVSFSDRHSDDQNSIVTSGDLHVELTTLDQLVSGLDHVHLLKIDVEGYELAVLRGATAVLRRCDAVLIELWGDDDPMELADFTITPISTGDRMRDVLCIRRVSS